MAAVKHKSIRGSWSQCLGGETIATIVISVCLAKSQSIDTFRLGPETMLSTVRRSTGIDKGAEPCFGFDDGVRSRTLLCERFGVLVPNESTGRAKLRLGAAFHHDRQLLFDPEETPLP